MTYMQQLETTGSAQQSFVYNWTATRLSKPPLIAPAQHYTYPQFVPGEESAMNRGALLLDIKPMFGANFLATCALGFKDTHLPTGVYACPRPDDMLALAGGYAYLIDTLNPSRCLHVPMQPVTHLFASPANGLLFLSGFHTVAAIGRNGLRWQTKRLSWEGVTISGVQGGRLQGTGWNLHTDREVPFSIDLENGNHAGGGYEV
jgi:hypothetical protein